MPPDSPPPLATGPYRILLIGLGTGFVGLGIVGAFVPVLPTTPFMLLAAACYVRASRKLHQRLLDNKTFGPMISNWQEHRAISRGARIKAISLIIVAISISILTVDILAVRLGLVAVAIGVITFLCRLTTRDPSS